MCARGASKDAQPRKNNKELGRPRKIKHHTEDNKNNTESDNKNNKIRLKIKSKGEVSKFILALELRGGRG
ncbi:hypothetical protein TW76_16820 [Pseudoalteromonas ruthenica]|nr:hypothetical protein TW76_16820 [Pseudoalteromonas ruthenica]TLX50908.1 hypothetical protein CWC31_09415 [Pseudoalteromonas ruthenica]TMO93649.1 hypothetical protein CWC13_05155 [Pseudoalteromonas ruthenica]TMO97647.1 hypothetical protein CWC07_14325 [Pseudoalteromonas ruthenica]